MAKQDVEDAIVRLAVVLTRSDTPSLDDSKMILRLIMTHRVSTNDQSFAAAVSKMRRVVAEAYGNEHSRGGNDDGDDHLTRISRGFDGGRW